MVSYHVFYQLMLLGLLWLFLMLHVVWPSARPAQKQRTTQPITPPHKRSKEPKPFITNGVSLLQTNDIYRSTQTISIHFYACSRPTTLPRW